ASLTPFRLDLAGHSPKGSPTTEGFMNRTLATLGLATLTLTLALPVRAQVSDHLKCVKVKDPLAKAAYNVDLSGLGPNTGCVVKVPGKLLCVETAKTVTGGPVPPGAAPGNPANRGL